MHLSDEIYKAIQMILEKAYGCPVMGIEWMLGRILVLKKAIIDK